MEIKMSFFKTLQNLWSGKTRQRFNDHSSVQAQPVRAAASESETTFEHYMKRGHHCG
jgi:hypothetical protein